MAIAAEIAGERGRKAAGLAVEAGQFTEFASQVNAMLPDPEQAPGAGRMTDADWLGIALVLRDRARDWPLVKSYWDKARQTTVGS